MLPPMSITFADGTKVEVKPRAADGIRFERTYNMPVMKAFMESDGIRLEHMWFFAYLAYSRDRDVPEFDVWMDTVEAVDFESAEADDELPLDRTP